MKKNQGYTLIEMIIVIAIIAILSGMSFVTLGIIKQAKCSEAANTISNQMGSLLTKTKALSEAKDKPLCLMIQYNDSDVTYSDGTTAKAGSYSIVLGYHDGTGFTVKSATPSGDYKAEATLPNILTVKYTSTDKKPCNIAGLDPEKKMVIEFNKANGSVRYGAGTYEIVYNGSTVATVHLDATTGNHYVK